MISAQIAKTFFVPNTACAVNGRLVLQEAVTGRNLRIAFNPKTFKVESIMELRGKCFAEAFSLDGGTVAECQERRSLADSLKDTASQCAKAWAEGEGRKTFKRLFR